MSSAKMLSKLKIAWVHWMQGQWKQVHLLKTTQGIPLCPLPVSIVLLN